MHDTGRLTGRRVLVVEDEYFIASDLQRQLTTEGAIIIGPVADLTQALAVSGEDAIDCAILDINLRGAPVFPVADRLRERSVPFMFLTGYDGWSIPDGYRDAARVAKPYPVADVLRTIEQLLRNGAPG
jgi:DNA-binding response OmpR family regulator